MAVGSLLRKPLGLFAAVVVVGLILIGVGMTRVRRHAQRRRTLRHAAYAHAIRSRQRAHLSIRPPPAPVARCRWEAAQPATGDDVPPSGHGDRRPTEVAVLQADPASGCSALLPAPARQARRGGRHTESPESHVRDPAVAALRASHSNPMVQAPSTGLIGPRSFGTCAVGPATASPELRVASAAASLAIPPMFVQTATSTKRTGGQSNEQRDGAARDHG